MIIPQLLKDHGDPQYAKCLRPVLVQEGGNDDDPHDPGGRTSRGITQREYNVFCKFHGRASKDVWSASWDDVADCYYENYWLPLCPKLWSGLSLMYFDQAVNQGPVQGARNVQRALNNFHDSSMTGKLMRAVRLSSGVVAVDGHIGPLTLDALLSINDKASFLKAYYNADMNFYHALRNWFRYGRGWGRRALEIYQQGVRMLL